jgi:hypothetical protein
MKLPLVAKLDNQFTRSDDYVVSRRNKVLSTKVSIGFSLLAEYLFESGLTESFTHSALLRDVVERLISEYHDGLVVYENKTNFDKQ